MRAGTQSRRRRRRQPLPRDDCLFADGLDIQVHTRAHTQMARRTYISACVFVHNCDLTYERSYSNIDTRDVCMLYYWDAVRARLDDCYQLLFIRLRVSGLLWVLRIYLQ